MKHYAFRANSLSNWAIARICREHGVEPDWCDNRIFADFPVYMNGKIHHWVSVNLTNCTKRELLAELEY